MQAIKRKLDGLMSNKRQSHEGRGYKKNIGPHRLPSKLYLMLVNAHDITKKTMDFYAVVSCGKRTWRSDTVWQTSGNDWGTFRTFSGARVQKKSGNPFQITFPEHFYGNFPRNFSEQPSSIGITFSGNDPKAFAHRENAFSTAAQSAAFTISAIVHLLATPASTMALPFCPASASTNSVVSVATQTLDLLA